jgi:hypothetical protein
MFAQTIETNLRRLLGAAIISLTLLIATASDDLSNASKRLPNSYRKQGIAEIFRNSDDTSKTAPNQPSSETFKKQFGGDLRKAFNHKLLEISLAKEPFLR